MVSDIRVEIGYCFWKFHATHLVLGDLDFAGLPFALAEGTLALKTDV